MDRSARIGGSGVTVIATASLLPIELVRRLTLPLVTALALNLLVVGYLIHHLCRAHTGIHSSPTP